MLPSISSWMMLPIIFHIISIYSIIITFIFHHLPYVSPALPSLCPRSWSATHWRCRPRCHAAPECSALRSWNEPRCWMILEWNDWIFCVFQTNWVDPKSQWFCACKNPKWTILDWVFGGFLVLHLLIDLNKWHGKSVAFLQSSLLNRWWELPLQWSNLATGKSGNISWLSV